MRGRDAAANVPGTPSSRGIVVKLLAKLCLLALVAAAVAPLFLRAPDGRPLMTLDDWTPDLDGLGARLAPLVDRLRAAGDDASPNAVGADREDGGSEGETIVWRWRDAAGVWHFAEAPPAGIEAEAVRLDPDANLVPGLRATAPTSRSGAAAASAPAPGASAPGPDALVDPAELRRRAETVRARAEARLETLEALESPASP
jgi:hypothetical protein